MGAKRISIDTDRRKGQLFKVSEYAGKYYVSAIDVGFIFDDQNNLGEARNMQDALEIIKASVEGTVRNMKISDW